LGGWETEKNLEETISAMRQINGFSHSYAVLCN